MSGHSKWHQIKHRKEAADQKRGALFSKILKAISVAARENADPALNPRLKTAIEKARVANVPNDNIERSISRSSENKQLEELVLEAYGADGSAIIIEAVTDNRNRTIAEIKHILGEYEAKLGEQGSARWAFDPPAGGTGDWRSKFTQTVSETSKTKLDGLVVALEEHGDIQKVTTNTQ